MRTNISLSVMLDWSSETKNGSLLLNTGTNKHGNISHFAVGCHNITECLQGLYCKDVRNCHTLTIK